MYDAKYEYAPVLALTVQTPRDEIGRDYHEEINLDQLFDDISVYNETVIPPEQMPRLGLLAAQTALACQGVAHLSVPSDIGTLPKRCKKLSQPYSP
ncbi:thiamine pyrophosphate-binding protein [Candidatus Coxiella mudrowiae]|uniref:thiamine pyrophosphate-binding protein n=1 Tax=Candidatus Coxiella mudrowiae TaxID=2054173 RepID=UPI00066219EA|nr:thiamine pyrophosphate-binding protein [Candidatus Coxiella mudrowiae]